MCPKVLDSPGDARRTGYIKHVPSAARLSCTQCRTLSFAPHGYPWFAFIEDLIISIEL